MIHSSQAAWEDDRDGQLGFWSVEGRLAEISAQGDPLETLAATVDFEMDTSENLALRVGS